jgi:AraC-like DNA-binding protein
MAYTRSDDPPPAAFGFGPQPICAEATGLLDEVREAIERNQADGARAAAARLVTVLAQTARPEGPMLARGGLAPWQRRRIERYLKEHLERPVQIEELAEQIRLSVSHFCRAFKETFRDTPHAYLIRMRLESAQEMMLATDEPLSQIALASGFADQAHLSKQFRRVVGETPSAWRRRHLTEAQVEARIRHATVGSARQADRGEHTHFFQEQQP